MPASKPSHGKDLESWQLYLRYVAGFGITDMFYPLGTSFDSQAVPAADDLEQAVSADPGSHRAWQMKIFSPYCN
jgi:hypothetical protein